MDDSRFSDPAGLREEVLDADGAASLQDGFAEGSGLLGMQPSMSQASLQVILGGYCRPVVPPRRCMSLLRCMKTVTPP